jgi:hypothetical protein
MPSRALLLLALAAPLCPQSLSPELPPGVLLGARIRERVKQRFAHTPEYTCLETLDRFAGVAGKNASKQIDTVRLEVLFAGREEFFDSPGGHTFQESNPGKFIASGFIGYGMFASYLEDIFILGNGLLQYRGEDDLDGRRAARFDFRVPSLQSATIVEVPGARGTVGMAGTFWADPVTYDLIRLKIDAVDVPPILQTLQITSTIDYAPMRLGEAEVLLPKSGDMLMVRDAGRLRYNRFDFTNCREYHAESAITFDDSAARPAAAAPGSSAPSARPQAAEQALPAELTVTIALSAPINERSAVDDLVEGKVVGNVIGRGGNVIVPEGTPVNGRIRMLEKAPEAADYFSIGLEFTDIDAAPAPFRFFADLVSSDPLVGLERDVMTRHSTSAPPASELHNLILLFGGMPEPLATGSGSEQRLTHPELPGVGFFFLHAAHIAIPAGFRMVWKTR